MNSALWVAKTGLEAQKTRLTVTANNLANANTTGFKRDHAVFEDLIYQNVRQPGAQSSQNTTLPSGLSLGTGVRVVATEKLHTQGGHIETGNSLDLKIQGRGFFQILKPNGSIAYTRDGSFQLDSNGQLVTSGGYPVEPAINIADNALSITVGVDGTVSQQLPGQPQAQVVGTITLADFVNPTGLQSIGENQFTETLSSGAPIVGTAGENGIGTMMQGALEASNVNTVEELVNMIETQRTFEMNSKAIAAADEMLQYINNNT